MHKIPSGSQTGARDDPNGLGNFLGKGLDPAQRVVHRAIVAHGQCPMGVVLMGQGFELLSDIGATIAGGHQEVNTGDGVIGVNEVKGWIGAHASLGSREASTLG